MAAPDDDNVSSLRVNRPSPHQFTYQSLGFVHHFTHVTVFHTIFAANPLGTQGRTTNDSIHFKPGQRCESRNVFSCSLQPLSYCTQALFLDSPLPLAIMTSLTKKDLQWMICYQHSMPLSWAMT
jgi:hypothetical protein